jgi:acyl dehydratase
MTEREGTPMLVTVGDAVTFGKTVTEADVLGFAEISGDHYEAHVDAEAMAASPFGQRIAHGALLVGLMSAAGTAMIDLVRRRGDTTQPVSLGYDRIRFVAPVFFGDSVSLDYVVTAVEPETRRSSAHIEARNQAGAVVAVADHVMKWL